LSDEFEENRKFFLFRKLRNVPIQLKLQCYLFAHVSGECTEFRTN